jgi:hypothetical protein
MVVHWAVAGSPAGPLVRFAEMRGNRRIPALVAFAPLK